MSEIIGYAAITADILHPGHIIFLQRARQKCDFLWVGVMSDEYIREVKKREPIMSWEERSGIVQMLRMVDGVIKQEKYEFDIDLLKNKMNINVIIDSVEHVDKRTGADIIIPMIDGKRESGTSSTQIRETCYAQILKEIYEGINNSERAV